MDALREEGEKIGVVGITCYRPWPAAAVREALAKAKRVVVVEKSLSVGHGGIVSANVRQSFAGAPDAVLTVVAGLGGRAITREALRRTFLEAAAGKLAPLTFLDLNTEVVDRALKREREVRRTGPLAEAVLKDVGTVTAQLR